jgi:hypothetical protein
LRLSLLLLHILLLLLVLMLPVVVLLVLVVVLVVVLVWEQLVAVPLDCWPLGGVVGSGAGRCGTGVGTLRM